MNKLFQYQQGEEQTQRTAEEADRVIKSVLSAEEIRENFNEDWKITRQIKQRGFEANEMVC